MAKRQTVWLSTMMILSLMVIGYYTVDDSLKPIPTSTTQGVKDSANPAKTPDTPKTDSKGQTDQKGQPDQKGQTDKNASAQNDWFFTQMMKQEQDRSAKTEQLQKVMADSKTSPEDKMKAEKEMKALEDFMAKAETAAEKVIQEGFEDALVTQDSSQFTVTVLAAQLSKEQAAKIYNIVSKELNVPVSKITVVSRQS
jgi:stage III sporulation protein AH